MAKFSHSQTKKTEMTLNKMARNAARFNNEFIEQGNMQFFLTM